MSTKKVATEENTTELIVVEQLPIITERLLEIKDEITKRTQEALALDVSEETVKYIKTVRTELKKDFSALESKRKEVKKAIMTPYDAFEEIYKSCVTDIFAPADQKLSQKINAVEDGLKARKAEDVQEYFDELCKAKNIDFVSFEQTGAVVNLSVTAKKLKDTVKSFLDKVSGELEMIETQEHKAEILVEYKKSLNAAASIKLVSDRVKAILQERERAQAAELQRAQRAAAAANVDAVVESEQLAITEPLAAPAVEQAPNTAEEKQPEAKLYVATFTVTGTAESLKALKQFLVDGGYNYVSK